MSIKNEKRSWKGLNPDEQIEAALEDGLSRDRSGIDGKPVYAELAKSSKPQYEAMMEVWKAYERKYPGSDPRSMEVMKHFTEVVGRATPGRLDKEKSLDKDKNKKRATVKTIRNKIRKFMSQWQRETHLTIPKDVHDSMAPYIKNVLRHKIPLSIEEKEPTYLTIENYVAMEEFHWLNDHHNYIHEASRVDSSALLKMHCYTSARLQEICKAKYKDLLCMVAWKDGEPEIKLRFKRERTKGMQDNPNKPKHPIYERLNPTPPLLVNGLLFLLAIFISARAFKDYDTIEAVLNARPPPRRRFGIMEWADAVLDDPVFPEMSVNGPTKKEKNESAWGHQCSDWAKRADFPGGIGLHAPRREALIKVDDGGYSLGQVMKFAAHRNPRTLVGHYLDNTSNVDGAAVFLGLQPRRDLTEDFRSASMKRNPDLPQSIPSKSLDELKHRPQFVALCEQIEDLSLQLTADITEEERKALKAKRRQAYDRRQLLVDEELENCRKVERRVQTTQSEADDHGDWRRSYFNRVVRHMVPERDRLARTLPLAVPLRSPEGISTLRDLVALRANDSRVAYQEVLRPTGDSCPVSSCNRSIKDVAVKDRWKHIYWCSKGHHTKQFGFAEFCFRCSRWITNENDWEIHCQTHIDNLDVPLRCDPVTFRHAVACTGYCCGCLRKVGRPAAVRMQQYPDRGIWQRHISGCIPEYVASLNSKDYFPCPHLLCSTVLFSESGLWHHLEDFHGTPKPQRTQKRQRSPDQSVNYELEPPDTARRKRSRPLAQLEGRASRPRPSCKSGTKRHPSEDTDDRKFVNISALNFDPNPPDGIQTLSVIGSFTSRCTTQADSVWDAGDDCISIDSSLSSLSSGLFEAVPEARKHCPSPWATPSEAAAATIPIDPEIIRRGRPAADFDQIEVVDLTNPHDKSVRIEYYQLWYSNADLSRSRPAAIEPEDNQWKIEKLLGKRQVRRRVQHLVKWFGYPDNESTWEPPENVHPDDIGEFEALYHFKSSEFRHSG
ncbi:hypothetical protein Z517_06480 [Fonsecaea pedrosoi CBS 271.37]|uniref:Chromo domain-containing protein n=1 Tax=Fonsecaea pedrosoi CBS 271.37 TaxID=1442368 RepID=A0A0D2GMU4_9EURO|nr:uncharacterized protein Z517_06480 [Fonsecaea pedrosoi CBS 271.37]KIW79865.1 hypothetical protein Z517_06480 [Fonsecaea pedrosoi CBS 271.37]